LHGRPHRFQPDQKPRLGIDDKTKIPDRNPGEPTPERQT
jgi:hypothetical protein